MTEQNLSPKLLHNLEQHYTQVGLMWEEGVPFEEAVNHIKVSYQDLEDMHLVMFYEHPKYKVHNIFGDELIYKMNASTLQSQEVNNDEAL